MERDEGAWMKSKYSEAFLGCGWSDRIIFCGQTHFNVRFTAPCPGRPMETWKLSKSEKMSHSAQPNFKQSILRWAKKNRNRGLIAKIPAAAPVWLSVLTDLWVIALKMAPDSCCIGVSEILRRFASYRRCSSAPDVQVGDLLLALYTHIQGD